MKKTVYLRDKPIGDGKVTIQSMTNTPTSDGVRTLAQIKALSSAGADFVRISIPDDDAAEQVAYLCAYSPVPLIGDIHFDARPALKAIQNGIAKIRINPSNLSRSDLEKIVKTCIEYDVPIRVGVNKGSVKRKISPAELVDLTLESARIIEDLGWDKLVLAVKTSDPVETVAAYRLLASKTDHPLHVGLTESGTWQTGLVKSSVVIGSLLLDNIGDTIRVSLAGDPVKEVYAAKNILRSVGLDNNYVRVIACPTCARTEIDVENLASMVEEMTKDYFIPLKIAVMGCVVNGIGEGKDADFGVAGGKDRSIIFRNGEIYKTVPNDGLKEEILSLCREYVHD